MESRPENPENFTHVQVTPTEKSKYKSNKITTKLSYLLKGKKIIIIECIKKTYCR